MAHTVALLILTLTPVQAPTVQARPAPQRLKSGFYIGLGGTAAVLASERSGGTLGLNLAAGYRVDSWRYELAIGGAFGTGDADDSAGLAVADASVGVSYTFGRRRIGLFVGGGLGLQIGGAGAIDLVSCWDCNEDEGRPEPERDLFVDAHAYVSGGVELLRDIRLLGLVAELRASFPFVKRGTGPSAAWVPRFEVRLGVTFF